jgi:hypothetical protein
VHEDQTPQLFEHAGGGGILLGPRYLGLFFGSRRVLGTDKTRSPARDTIASTRTRDCKRVARCPTREGATLATLGTAYTAVVARGHTRTDADAAKTNESDCFL